MLEDVLRKLLFRLEQVGENHEEIYDTECRDRMSNAIFDGYVRRLDGFTLPSEFGLYALDANEAVREALGAYIAEANEKATALQLSSFHERLSALQNGEVKSIGGNYFDDFFGYLHPDAFNEEGECVEAP